MKYLPCRSCSKGEMQPVIYKGIISNLKCDYCETIEVTHDMSLQEYRAIVQDYENNYSNDTSN